LWTNADAVVWLPENSIVRAGTGCFVSDIKVNPGSLVNKGDALVECEDEVLIVEREMLEAKYRELDVRYVQEVRTNRFKAAITAVELDTVEADLARARERVDSLVVKSPADGLFRVPLVQDLEGRYVNKGDVLGYIIQEGPVTVRMAVTQSDVELVRGRAESVEVLVADKDIKRLVGTIRREIPGASEQLPNAALGTVGGGKIPVDPREPAGLTAFQKIFQFDVALPDDFRSSVYGGRVHVRINHGAEPVATQLYWGVREVFLDQFGV
jgi:putative peptide zinc metalloprotease protein